MIGILKTIYKSLNWKGWTLVLVGVLILGLISQCTVNKIINNIGDNKQTTENNKDRDIREKLSADRQKSEAALVANEVKLNETLAQIPASVPSPRRLARACYELRNDGYVELPPACGPKADSGT